MDIVGMETFCLENLGATCRRAALGALLVAAILQLRAPVALAVPERPALTLPSDEIADIKYDLARRFYWQRSEMYGYVVVSECQLQFGDVCIGERETIFDRPLVSTRGGGVGTGVLPRRLPDETEPPSGRSAPELLRAMADTAADNGWAVGHLTVLSSNGGILGYSLQTAAECRSGAGWCTALQGFAMHHFGQFAEADSLFERALSLLPEVVACRWRDISPLLNDASAHLYRSQSCSERRDLEARFWHLADPLHALPGNDRRSEHLYRRVLDSLYSGLPSPFHAPDVPDGWNSELSDMLMRFGVPRSYANYRVARGQSVGMQRWAIFGTPTYSFAPSELDFNSTEPLSGAKWQLWERLENVRERYHPSYDFVFEVDRPHIARFRRGDSLLVYTAVGVADTPFAEAAPYESALILSQGNEFTTTSRANEFTDHSVLAAMTANAPHTLALEIMSLPFRLAGRARVALRPIDGSSATQRWLSDMLLYAASDTTRQTLGDVAATMLPASTMRIDDAVPLGIYWESGGFPADTVITFVLTATRAEERRGGIIGALVRRLSGRGAAHVVRIAWDERVRRATSDLPSGVVPHRITIDTRSLPAGEYSLTLEVDGDSTLAASHSVTLLDRPPQVVPLLEALQQAIPKHPMLGRWTSIPRLRPRCIRSYELAHRCETVK